MSNIAIDLMGGDQSPQAIIEALKDVSPRHPEVTFHAVGTQCVNSMLSSCSDNIRLHIANVSLDSDEPLSKSLRHKTNSTMGYCVALLQSGDCDAMISAGNTAALMSLGCMYLKTKAGIRRPAIMSQVQYRGQVTALVDLGANIGATAEDLYANAKMAAEVYSGGRIALLNVGVEQHKGTALVKQADGLMRDDPDLNYVGYIEGDQLLSGPADIVVCDGFIGNCVTKLLESVVADLHTVVPANLLPKMATAAQLMGLNGQVFKAHGKSSCQDMIQALELVVQHTQTIFETN